MSRHKLVKQLDLGEELDDYDGGADYDETDDEGISADDREQLQEGTIRVRAVLGSGFEVTDQKIQEALWHYYYNVEKPNEAVKLEIKIENEQDCYNVNHSKCWSIFDDPHIHSVSIAHKAPYFGRSKAVDFFMDAPWCNIPPDRQGEILIEPLCTPGRLLGGSSSQSSGKVSKLAALAAARRGKENAKPESSSMSRSVVLLDKLSSKKSPGKATDLPTALESPAAAPALPMTETIPNVPRKYPVREHGILGTKTEESTVIAPESQLPEGGAPEDLEEPFTPAAPPSAFAKTVFGHRSEGALPPNQYIPCYNPLQSSYYIPFHNPDAKLDFFVEPSPDDVVLKAQSSKGPRATKSTHDKELNGVAQVVSDIAITETSKTKSKNLDVVDEFEKKKTKPSANFVVIGHVDAGKSTLMGRLLYDLKVVDQRTLNKYRKEAESIGKSSFALAWVLDQGTDERSQGVTIDIGMNRFETEKTAFTIFDAPGHRDFIPNMIAGASQADFAVLVIDASTGSFESGLKGQTKEHALLVRSMSVQRIIVAVNKLDTLSWSRDRFDEIQQQVSAFLTAAGFQPKNLAFLPCSGLTGENVVCPASDPNASWYAGPPLLSLLESSEPFARALKKPLRLTIDDIFRGGVQNPLSVCGRIDTGSVQVGDVGVVVPSNVTASIKGIEIDSEPNDWAVAGQNVILHLADIDQKYLKIGDIICSPSAPVKALSKFTMKVLAFEHILPMAIEVHRGRLHSPGRISKLVAVLDKASGKPKEGGKKKVKIVTPGSVARVVVETDEPVPLEAGGKVVLRAGGQTVGAGLLEQADELKGEARNAG